MRLAETLGIPVVFTSTHTLYPQVISRWNAGSVPSIMDLPDSTIDKFAGPSTRFYQLNKGIRLDRDFARVHARRFGFPPLATQETLDTTAAFVVLESGARLPRGVVDINVYWRLLFPRHRAKPVGEMLTLFERVDAGSRPARSTSR